MLGLKAIIYLTAQWIWPSVSCSWPKVYLRARFVKKEMFLIVKTSIETNQEEYSIWPQNKKIFTLYKKIFFVRHSSKQSLLF